MDRMENRNIRPRYNRDRNRDKNAIIDHRTQEGTTVINIGSPDPIVMIVVVLLVLIGLVMVFSSSYYTAAQYGDAFYYVKRQSLYALIGVFITLFMINVNYKILSKFAVPIYIVAVILLTYVLFTEPIKGVRRWITIPVLGQFQPSEIGKVATILITSQVIATRKNILKNWPGFLVVCALVGVLFLLVALGNLSTSILVAATGFGIIFVASPHILRFVMAGLGAVCVLIGYLSMSDGFRGGRFDAWIDPFSDQLGFGYQTIQSLYAIGSGGLFGLGLGQSRQKLGFIPESHNDIIFSIICEELGFFGAAFVLVLFAILIWRGTSIALNAHNVFGSLLASGITILLGIQALINVAVVTNTIPNTGVPLPFISAGGTSMLVNMFLIGVLLNISRYSRAR